jgi:hypothetical protein
MMLPQRKGTENAQVSEQSDLRHRPCGNGVVAAHAESLGGGESST